MSVQGDQRSCENESVSQWLPRWLWVAVIALAGWGTFSANPLLTPAAILVLVSCIQLLWRRGEPPILLFACAMQWLQASAIIFYTNSYGISLERASGSPEYERATWLSLGAILALVLGMRLALVRCRISQHGPLLVDALRVNIIMAFGAYLVSFCIAGIIQSVLFVIPAITQLIHPFIALKWMAVFILAYCVIEQRRGYILLTVAVLLEVAVGVLGFFAGFKSVFFILLVVALSSPLALKGRRLALSVFVVIALFFFGVVWSAIKAEYREFLNQGTSQQEVVVSMDESVIKLGDLLADFTWDNFSDGLEAMILRVGYVQYFALTLINVPDRVPYEHGTLWFGAVEHLVTPRLFFPDKPEISDSARTTLYTGIQTAGEERGTSIGIGYVGESYIDFGPIFMFMPIFLLGFFYGLIYRVFALRSRHKLIGTSIAAAILIFGAYTIETSNIKLVGGNVTAVLVIGSLYLAFGRPLKDWLEHS